MATSKKAKKPQSSAKKAPSKAKLPAKKKSPARASSDKPSKPSPPKASAAKPSAKAPKQGGAKPATKPAPTKSNPSKATPAAKPSQTNASVPKAPMSAPVARPPVSALVKGSSPKGKGSSPPAPPSNKLLLPPPKGKGGKDPLVLVPAAAKASDPGKRPAPTKAQGLEIKPKTKGAALSARSSDRPQPITTPLLPMPVRRNDTPLTLEQRSSKLEERLAKQSPEFRARYDESLEMSWIYHDSALEGSVYTLEELRAGLSKEPMLVTDSSLQPAADEIRRHKEAIEYIRDFGKRKMPVTIDVIKKIFLILHPSEGDIKTVKYRKDIPQHRLYFHEYAQPDKIAYKARQVVDWINEPETKKTRSGLRIAARAHYDLLRVFPFQTDSGKVARLFMNLLLIRTGYPAAIIHSTERQRYYDALKGSANTILSMVQESVENSLASVEKLLDEHETKTRSFVA